MQFSNPVPSPIRQILCIVLIFFRVSACGQAESDEKQAYIEQINAWHQKRVSDLTGPGGWLNLAGLFELRDGENTLGANSSNDILFPAGKAPSEIGTLYIENHTARIVILPEVIVTANGDTVRELQLQSDKEGSPTVLQYGSLRWYIIDRGGRLYLRLRDLESEAVSQFKGIRRFPVDPNWRLPATFEPYTPPKKIPVPNILGQINHQESPGALRFVSRGQSYRLDVLGKRTDPELFVIFADETNGIETYPAGRFVYVQTPGEDNQTFIDFNKAYNPPCAFTPYATCPLPPEQNRLPIRITAGEMNYESAEH